MAESLVESNCSRQMFAPRSVVAGVPGCTTPNDHACVAPQPLVSDTTLGTRSVTVAELLAPRAGSFDTPTSTATKVATISSRKMRHISNYIGTNRLIAQAHVHAREQPDTPWSF
jgi:hypothetical protein